MNYGGNSIPGLPGIATPNAERQSFPGVYRAVVGDDADPQLLRRVRVRVVGIHTDEIPNDHLPWAEVACSFGGKVHGDTPSFEVGDLVWVMFEAGDRRHPVVMGSWMSRSMGVADGPSGHTTADAKGRQRWVRASRTGQAIELSDVSDELWAKMSSGAAEVVVDSKDGSVTLRARHGVVTTDAAAEDHTVRMYTLDGEQIIMTASAFDELGAASGVLQVLANLRTVVHASGVDGVVDLGGYLPRYQGEPSPFTPGMQARQTRKVYARSRKLVLGVKAAATEDGAPLPETETVEIEGVEVTIEALQAVNSPSGATIKVTIRSAEDVLVQSVGGKVTIDAPEVDIEGATRVKVECTDSLGRIDITSAGDVNIASGGGGNVNIS